MNNVQLKVLDGSSSEIYPQFLQCFLSNTPAVIRNCRSSEWLVSRKISQLGPVEGILSLFRHDLKVPVDSADFSKGYESSGRVELTLKEFFNRCVTQKEKGLYLKDWHAFLHDEDKSIYELFDVFLDDWLNWYYRLSLRQDDYRFIYIGGEETCTALHHDVCCSYSWSVNVYGHKKWLVLNLSGLYLLMFLLLSLSTYVSDLLS